MFFAEDEAAKQSLHVDKQMKTDLEHTNQPSKCLVDSIYALAEDCDNEYYMSAVGPSSYTLLVHRDKNEAIQKYSD